MMEGFTTVPPQASPPPPYAMASDGLVAGGQGEKQSHPRPLPIIVQQPPVQATVTGSVPPGTTGRYSKRSCLVLGALQIVVGFVAIIIHAVGLGVGMAMSHVGHGIWGGIFVSM